MEISNTFFTRYKTKNNGLSSTNLIKTRALRKLNGLQQTKFNDVDAFRKGNLLLPLVMVRLLTSMHKSRTLQKI